MRRLSVSIAAAAGTALLLALAYLLFWPVPVQPKAWQAPGDEGHVDPYEANNRLRAASIMDLGGHSGPEDAALGPDGVLYLSSNAGVILRIAGNTQAAEVWAHTEGRPLGIEFDGEGNLLIANAELGLQRINREGTVELLLDSVAGEALVYPNDVAVAADGKVYLSEATRRFSPASFGGTYASSILDLIEHGTSGRVIEFDPANGTSRVFADGLSFANGVAVSADQRYLLVAETGAYRIWRYPLDGAPREILIDNLPDFPDNLNNGLQGRIWVGLVAPRNPLLDRYASRPFLRKVIQRLPANWRPKAEPHSHVIAVNVDGQVLMNLQDTAAGTPMITGVLETRQSLYLTSLTSAHLARLDKRDLATQ